MQRGHPQLGQAPRRDKLGRQLSATPVGANQAEVPGLGPHVAMQLKSGKGIGTGYPIAYAPQHRIQWRSRGLTQFAVTRVAVQRPLQPVARQPPSATSGEN